ncbi:LuxR C-terminal-related transcriptional regulator [Patulibacter sp. SYSU D01012]|uniref:helix-turn-helix transcriptional regulator n=1 Tax=Patulibacter sp. SYSU D01012 TaxID=2817381 RepID=UPI001FF01832|nr:LuxR C-terminal-related transcriptional regulator [Patulibacter sp. SYSU D01012]
MAAHHVRAIAAIGREAARAGDRDVRVGAALGAVAELTGCDALVLAAWDPVLRAHRPLRTWGYRPEDLAGDRGGDLVHDPGYQYARRTRRPLRLTDVRARRPPLDGVLALERFSEGLTHCLHTADGRYVGALSCNVLDGAPYDEGRLAAVGLAGLLLAELTDVTATLRSAAAVLPAGMAAVAVGGDGAVGALAGRPSSPLLLPGAELLRCARAVAPVLPGATAFLHDAGAAGLVRAVVVRPGGDDGALLVGVEPAAPPLSRRELQVLTLVAEGCTNPEIAARLHLSRPTVATHLAHILDRLGVGTRGAAAARAVREGLLLIA